jgi:hypothetical protein
MLQSRAVFFSSGSQRNNLLEDKMNYRNVSKIIFAAALVLVMLSTKSFSQDQEALNAAQKYLTALETFQFQAAYDNVSAEDRSVKTLEQFQNENAAPFIKAMQMDDKSFFKFVIKNSKAENNTVVVNITTTGIVMPGDKDTNYAVLCPMAVMFPYIKMDMAQKKQDPTIPAQVNAAFKNMLPGKGEKKIPFAPVEKVIKLVQTNGKWVVSTGWKEAADKLVEAAAKNIIEMAKGSSMTYPDAIKRLQDMKLKMPTSKVIADGLALFDNCISSMQKIILTPSDPMINENHGKEITVTISNKSDMKPKSFDVEYTLLDAKGNVLRVFTWDLKGEFFVPPAPNGCMPGYVGKMEHVQSTSETELIEKWAKTTLKLKSVRYSFD